MKGGPSAAGGCAARDGGVWSVRGGGAQMEGRE